MREPRIYIDEALASDLELCLSASASHHLQGVLRRRVGQRLRLFNGEGGSYLAEISAMRKREVIVRLLDFEADPPAAALQITLAQGISRAQHMDYTLQKAVELGVGTIVPLFTEFGNVQLEGERIDKKVAHWQKIIIGACEQSERNSLPLLLPPQPITQWLASDSNALRLLLQPASAAGFAAIGNKPESVSLLSGPEGGFSETEVTQALAADYRAVAMGPRILRTETAALAAISICQCLWGDMG